MSNVTAPFSAINLASTALVIDIINEYAITVPFITEPTPPLVKPIFVRQFSVLNIKRWKLDLFTICFTTDRTFCRTCPNVVYSVSEHVSAFFTC